jgi:hypothetical protein
MRGGGTYGYTTQKKERKKKQMKNVSKQEKHMFNIKSSNQTRKTPETHKLQEDSIPKI